MIARNYKPIVYFEGVRMPVTSVSATFRANGKSVIQITMPGDPELWPKVDISDVSDGTEKDNGLTVVSESDLQGIQPRTLIHLFVEDSATGEEIFLTEARITNATLSFSKAGTQIQIVAFGSVFFLEEVALYMVETQRSLGVNSNDDWDGRRGTTSTSNIVSKLKDQGLANGIKNLLEDAGLNSSQATNLTWRLLRIGQRLSIINNPTAMGHFNDARLASILDKTIGQVSSTQPIAAVVMQVLRLLRYFVVNIPAPSFLNAQYSGNGVIESVGDQVEVEDDVSDSEEEISVFRENVEYSALLTDLSITNADELQMNDLCIFPQMPMAPPPRCNVFFPIDFDSLKATYAWEQRPTRGISRAGGRAALRGDEDDGEAIKIPEQYASGSVEYGRYYTSAEEKYRGIIMSTFNHDKPEFLDDIGSSYVKGYMTQSYYNKKYNGSVTLNTPCPLNLKPIPGMPALILMRNGQHILAHLDQVVHILTVDQGCYTMPQFSMPRHYTELTPLSSTALWFEASEFEQKNIGVYIYKSIIGKYFTAEDELSADAEIGDDLSILKHLYRNTEPGPDSTSEIELVEETDDSSTYSMTVSTAIEVGLKAQERAESEAEYVSLPMESYLENYILIELFDTAQGDLPSREDFELQNPIVKDGSRLMTIEEVEEAKSAETAIQDAADLLWAEYKDHKYPEIYSFNYGRRIPVTRKHLFEDFYNAVVSTDLMMVTGGYELETNSLSLSQADRETLGVELGGIIDAESDMGEIKPMGCFVRERQACYVKPAARLFYGADVARDSSELLDILVESDEVGDTETENLLNSITIQRLENAGVLRSITEGESIPENGWEYTLYTGTVPLS